MKWDFDSWTAIGFNCIILNDSLRVELSGALRGAC